MPSQSLAKPDRSSWTERPSRGQGQHRDVLVGMCMYMYKFGIEMGVMYYICKHFPNHITRVLCIYLNR